MDDSTNSTAQGEVKDCGCHAGANGEPCEACKAGHHHECNSGQCTWKDKGAEGGQQ